MRFSNYIKKISLLLIIVSIAFISGCSEMVLMNPKGQIGLEERNLILTSLGLMLIVVIPAIAMAIIFAIQYRASNLQATYNPNLLNSTKIELVVWSIPILIISFLAYITWNSTHRLDPYKPIASAVKPINIQVIALDWKWLFIYPEYSIATVNEIVFPVNVPIHFNITSNSVMNSFFIPQLGGQIYAMAGMNSTLNLIANKNGSYKGISSNFSGRGFSDMKFSAIATKNNELFYQWIKKVKSSPYQLSTMSAYEHLAVPSINNAVEYFSNVKPDLYKKVIGKFMNHSESMTITSLSNRDSHEYIH
ncbi:ubiquinol oxidase subunit II [Candidatus Palibaumannia cicadellinicola]|uniref:Ubiquinol oxidase subunit 2 n=1 Tax=Baumannia cicadellinicola subsp. Homalodisca coagulata TaxID=374463 RepID=Q1LTJ7_BAUCH|nr:ubiquinol oxidase subunit II [Candidatus Baumannia cicadellinicola]ABF14100.1 ubiquinol oxidase, subunit II [Baumannia cicadellinicola str. Hc (Homalodisca coagulata)]MBS0032710.1 ubiquinol oxidase subunit II [Candidatus Baumannia cicadellinicola]MCJ7462300.1 ubiquinol oxidase subunit II [Candidatus Baumannia cicadellinicola]MCJ7462820.1 ubiquinol oxidase subunit II [Candidatus Baumannia cicadellinicola]